MSGAFPPKWISKKQVLYIHEAAIKKHGGSFGVRDMGLLESALARPENFYAYGEQDLFLLAAAYAEGIARNHPFIDGNKRTAYSAAGLFLYVNGYTLAVPSVAEQIRLFENLAMGQVSRTELAQFYRQNTRQR
ncbi:MAG: type II toxin-antitoxin system death-on-curing family toxin [Caldilineaceae bacterium]